MAKQSRYSKYLRPINYVVDLALLFFLALQFQFSTENYLYFLGFSGIMWVILSIKNDFYEVYRFTKLVRIISSVLLQGFLFSFVIFAFFGIFEAVSRPFMSIFIYLLQFNLLVLLFKISLYYLLKRYRSLWKGNSRRVTIIGKGNKTRQLQDFFAQQPEYGYDLFRIFQTKENNQDVLETCFKYVIDEQIDEIYCSMASLSNKEINQLIHFADNNLVVLKFIPDNKDVFTKKLKVDYYKYLPILSLRKIPIDTPINKFTKRLFDIFASLFVIVFILSWLTPLLAILIKLSSKGPVFFKQSRNGLDYKEFYCYKFRSMRINKEANEKQVSKEDSRITWIGKVIRKTSIDELPQFINVLKGEMSVVGPRPHMVSHTYKYAEQVDKFMVRHFVKPGISGLAQVSGFRGEVDNQYHITNRIRYDIFYLENWSLILDFKIIFLTIYNAIRGDEKAY